MTKGQAIKQAREFIQENKEYDPIKNVWYQYTRPAGTDPRHELKNRRIAYALELLGVNSFDAQDYAYECYNIPFRDALYKFSK